MAWFRRKKKNIQTSTEEKKDTPKGLWYKTPTGKIIETEELERNNYVSPEDDFHVRIGSQQYFEILFDDKKYEELHKNIESKDPLNWEDSKKYTDRIKETKKKTGLKDSIRTATGNLEGKKVVVSAMDFNFIGGSLGSAMGEKIVRAIDYSIKNNLPYILICKSGGARMMEAAHSLMQMAKVEAKLIQLANKKLPYITLLTDPTFGGITASFGMMGDITLAEPGALIGFAGPRVIRETIGQDLPEGFQTSEFLLEKGFIDVIVHRSSLKMRLSQLIDLLME
ncbi:Acetyl-coenzyme A carboxylase carboxyl transferase subunit beta [Candidatus Ornithobacterium hominis]|uniref:Acetyl-coenzyme A carboxylase carboxyl transferase subunit beta n=1 Tax=Candidatus Ornithobacterium hominis TaxID=2497989 RepID=A0A383U0W8_9FLAO|nr:acetyl-CoA carboxylase, carboxyltransferase subunit beta [Candidatus Ornithobacterium hominis]MCT7904977.1 acetyl-CoA carboxylase, carboxyltransferase subunit beta [Candidatus Ornithobacterium hominis]CAI9429936.1 acetyl-CoA carboxylase, carboxyltransferase subunit beta [Candidatus Ornithobacterium hominis]SZD73484.1 Acetyl-coenzyme A carboxylase carboxyl transferase subunit beta [Candidatus Ornithobacterium hominis]